MLISEKQQEANRQSAQHSTGPTTSAGKAAASLNAVTYGLRARTLLLPGEDYQEYQRLCAALEAEWQPQTPTERFYLETMSTAHWLLARADISELYICQAQLPLEKESILLDRVAARRTRLERSYTTAMHELERLQKERQAKRPEAVEATHAKPAKPATQPPASPPDYVMSDATEGHAAFADTR
jgi:hypothetical protein